jgi:hypothetical protein
MDYEIILLILFISNHLLSMISFAWSSMPSLRLVQA